MCLYVAFHLPHASAAVAGISSRANSKRAGLHRASLEGQLRGHRMATTLHAGDPRGGGFRLVPELLEPTGLAVLVNLLSIFEQFLIRRYIELHAQGLNAE